MKKITILFIMSIFSISAFSNSTSIDSMALENILNFEINRVDVTLTDTGFNFIEFEEFKKQMQ